LYLIWKEVFEFFAPVSDVLQNVTPGPLVHLEPFR
jgi:hypothetical protein